VVFDAFLRLLSKRLHSGMIEPLPSLLDRDQTLAVGLGGPRRSLFAVRESQSDLKFACCELLKRELPACAGKSVVSLPPSFMKKDINFI
jgi:hypothetical protein